MSAAKKGRSCFERLSGCGCVLVLCVVAAIALKLFNPRPDFEQKFFLYNSAEVPVTINGSWDGSIVDRIVQFGKWEEAFHLEPGESRSLTPAYMGTYTFRVTEPGVIREAECEFILDSKDTRAVVIDPVGRGVLFIVPALYCPDDWTEQQRQAFLQENDVKSMVPEVLEDQQVYMIEKQISYGFGVEPFEEIRLPGATLKWKLSTTEELVDQMVK